MDGFDNDRLTAHGVTQSIAGLATPFNLLTWPVVRWFLWQGLTPEQILQMQWKEPWKGIDHPGRKSWYRGVSYDKTHHKWKARIMQAYKSHTLGYSCYETLAAHMYDVAAIQMRGVDAKLNFSSPLPPGSRQPEL